MTTKEIRAAAGEAGFRCVLATLWEVAARHPSGAMLEAKRSCGSWTFTIHVLGNRAPLYPRTLADLIFLLNEAFGQRAPGGRRS